jgi:transposase-like protein
MSTVSPGRRYSQEHKDRVVAAARDGMTMPKLIETFGGTRNSISKWLDAAGVELTRVRDMPANAERGKRRPGQSLRNTPLALKLEENVQRRLEGKAPRR